MKTFNENIKRYFNKNKKYRKNNKNIKIYEFQGKYYLTNEYSIIILPIAANKNSFKRLSELKNDFTVIKINNISGITIDHDEIRFRNILKIVNDLKDKEFCNSIQKENVKIEDHYIKIKNDCNISFNINLIKNIQKIVNTDRSLYYSNNIDEFINISGKNGYAYLLGCKTF